MTGRDQHIPTDRLTALALVARAPQDCSPDNSADHAALAHLSQCDQCGSRFADLTFEMDGLRDLAFAQADDVFDDAVLDAQRTRILDRLAHLGQTARVITFPAPAREPVIPVSSTGRRWISVAAAAGLIIGLVAGQMLHFVPGTAFRDNASVRQVADTSASPNILPASASQPLLSEEELMEEVEAAIQLRRVRGLRVIDALTPTPTDVLALGRD